MAMRSLHDLLSMVLPHAPGCPNPVALKNLRLAAIEWCERTRAWRSITTATVTEQGFAVVAPDFATIHEIETASFEGVELMPTQFSEVDPSNMVETGAMPEYITQVSPNTVTLVPFKTGELQLTLFLKPRSGDEFGSNGAGGLKQDDQNQIPEHVFIQSGESIVFGALARLLLMPKVDWRDDKKGLYYKAEFDARVTDQFSSSIKGQQKAPARPRPQFI